MCERVPDVTNPFTGGEEPAGFIIETLQLGDIRRRAEKDALTRTGEPPLDGCKPEKICEIRRD